MKQNHKRIATGGIVLAIVGAVVVGAFGLHKRRDSADTARVIDPRVSELLDVSKIGHVPIRPENNAFDHYRRASLQLSPMSEAARKQNSESCRTGCSGGWQAIGADLRGWLELNRASLNHFREGSDCNEAVYCQPAEQTITDSMEVLRNLNEMRTLVELEILRLEADGDFGAAWSWCRALLRASRHSGLHGEFAERLVGKKLHECAVRSVVRWASFPEVTVAMLRVALHECRLIYEQTVAPSGPISIEYLIRMKCLSDQNGVAVVDQAASILEQSQETVDRSTEPAASIAALPLVFTNWLTQCDLPRHARHPVSLGRITLFQSEPGDGIGMEAFEQRLKPAFIVQTLGPNVMQFLDALDRELAGQRLMETALLTQIRLRESGSLPAKLEELIGTDLDELPVDPFAPGEHLHYRRNWTDAKTAKIWSIGSDEKDDDGLIDITSTNDLTGDIIVHVGYIEDLESTASP
jgi:hypothetical protein